MSYKKSGLSKSILNSCNTQLTFKSDECIALSVTSLQSSLHLPLHHSCFYSPKIVIKPYLACQPDMHPFILSPHLWNMSPQKLPSVDILKTQYDRAGTERHCYSHPPDKISYRPGPILWTCHRYYE